MEIAPTRIKSFLLSSIRSFDERIINHLYRGAVKFNVGLLGEPPAKTVTKATFAFTIERNERRPSADFTTSCTNRLFLATEDWPSLNDEGTVPATIAGVPYKSALIEGFVGSRINVDVTDVVIDWVKGKRTNFGFLFVSLQEPTGVIRGNDKCWTMFGDFVLEVAYTKP